MILSDALILPVSHLQTQQMMTLQIRSQIEYLIQTLYSFVNFIVKVDDKFCLNDAFQYDLMMVLDKGLLFWVTLYISQGSNTDESVIFCTVFAKVRSRSSI